MRRSLQSQQAGLRQAICDLNNSIEEARRKNDEIDARIEELEIAKGHAEQAVHAADDLMQRIFQTPSGEWAGTNWDEFEDRTRTGETYTSAKDLHQGCQALVYEIQAKIDAERSQRNLMAELIEGYMSMVKWRQDMLASIGRQLVGQGGA